MVHMILDLFEFSKCESSSIIRKKVRDCVE